ncbi:MAG TPA: DUF4350 domain-containing protein [Calditrichia bacterium]|nr:hypothetical protein [Calditrichota bacterium]HQU72251.1 DUF4350 domain-containing protein [Calditrichia bacterium]HQV30984.1 DUF4350 domain-containing protein [Calditrichia bacterium]
MSSQRKTVAGLILFGLIFLVIQTTAPRETDWLPSYSRNDKIPLGSYLIFDFLGDFFPGQQVETIRRPLYETLNDPATPDSINYLIINSAFGPDRFETDLILAKVRLGAHFFVAANNYSGALADSLNLKTAISYQSLLAPGGGFTSPALPESLSAPEWGKIHLSYYFSRIDTQEAVVAGKDLDGRPVFVKMAMGDGVLWLSSQPNAFTNFGMLHPGSTQYAATMLSFLPLQPVWWDEYYKRGFQGRTQILRYILGQPALRAAWYVLLLGAFLFVIFEGRRRQKAIPVIEPLQNETVGFVRTVSELYYQKSDHYNLSLKMINHFLEYLRGHFRVPTDSFSPAFVEKLSQRSGADAGQLRALFGLISRLRESGRCSESQLWELNQQIGKFYQQSGT